jgi:polyphosphate kinase
MIRSLYEASQAGVEIDLIVRGICCLKPGLPGVSERIRVRSLIGRFLEHSRIFHFHNDGQPEYLIGSADLMPRNLDRRVEATVPVVDPELQAKLQHILDLCLEDERQAWELHGATWTRVLPNGESAVPGVQVRLMQEALDRRQL